MRAHLPVFPAVLSCLVLAACQQGHVDGLASPEDEITQDKLYVVQDLRFAPPKEAQASKVAVDDFSYSEEPEPLSTPDPWDAPDDGEEDEELPEVSDIVFGIPDAPPVPEPEVPLVVGRMVQVTSENARIEDENYEIARMRAEAEALERELKALEEEPKPKAKKVPIPDPTSDEPIPHWRRTARYETSPVVDALRLSVAFRRERDRVDGLAFQTAVGTWANTYVPGDRTAAWLAARLARGDDRGDLPADAALHDAARPAVEPFDAPRHAAVDVTVAADRKEVGGPSRLLVQVGLQATPAAGGRRPALHLAVVLDLESLPAGASSKAQREAMKALVEAFSEARDVGDRFVLLASGQRVRSPVDVGDAPPGLVLPEDAFRHGPLRLTLPVLLSGQPSAARSVRLEETLASAEAILQAGGDALLGSRQVLLVTARAYGDAADRLEIRAHESAVAGIPWSVVGLDGAWSDELGRIARAGQGQRRFLAEARGAEALVRRELADAGRLVARALRVDVRLAPGVKLVEVVGSRRLDETGRQRVREAEQYLNETLQRELGIRRDRGDEEDGIRVFIPTFFAGDAHAILLDVVAPGPGSVAEVEVRYKDLVRLRNGVVHGHLALPRGDDPPGPLQHRVTRNYLAHRLAERLDVAARWLADGEAHVAIELLEEHRQLLDGLLLQVPELGNTSALRNDASLLAEYVSTLRAAGADQELLYLERSLRYAALLRRGPYRADSAG